MSKPVKMNRKEVIKEVLMDLNSLEGIDGINKYALEMNKEFFRNSRTVGAYLLWLFLKFPKLEGDKLLELSDFSIEKWEKKLQNELIAVEKRDFPGLIKPLVDRITDFFLKENRPLIVINFGSGGMEVELQVIKNLSSRRFSHLVTFIGADKSAASHAAAKRNLQELGTQIEICETSVLGRDIISEKRALSPRKHLVILSSDDIFNIESNFPMNYFDLIFHALFKHHLSREKKGMLDSLESKMGKRTMEYDGYRSFIQAIPQTLAGWHDPVFLNAAIFSNARYFSKREIRTLSGKSDLSFFRMGYYLAERVSQNI